jgi:hypothetical protein
VFCILKSGPAAGRVDLTFNAFRRGSTSLFSVWRAWRGTPEDFRNLLRTQARVDAPGASAGPAPRLDRAVVERAAPALLSGWSDVFSKVEFCELGRGEICPSLRGHGPAAPGIVAQLHLEGLHRVTARQAFERLAQMSGERGEFGKRMVAELDKGKTAASKASFLQSIALSNHDWSVPAGHLAALLLPVLGAQAEGGDLVAMDDNPPADAQTRARMQAYMVATSHVAWRLGADADRTQLMLYPGR